MNRSEESKSPLAEPGSPDWFLSAIVTDGSVGDCLAAVLRELSSRSAFVSGLKRSLDPPSPDSSDAVTVLGQKVRALENTLRFRLGILRPERPQAWFRPPAVASTGPFTSTLLSEPVFTRYDESRPDELETSLVHAFNTRVTGGVLFLESGPSLWRTLLQLNADWEKIVRIPVDGVEFRLDQLPDGLPAFLESRALRAFLINVRGEILTVRQRLDHCFHELMETSRKLFQVQRDLASRRHSDGHGPGAARTSRRDAAGEARDEMRRRRQAAKAKMFLTPQDIQALQFMGFEDMPSGIDLRSRYLDLAKRLHPDREGGDEQKFRLLSLSYEHLAARAR